MTTQRKLETRIVTTEQMLRIVEESAKPFDRSNVWHYAEIWNRYLGDGKHELTIHSELSEEELSEIDALLGINVELVDLKRLEVQAKLRKFIAENNGKKAWVKYHDSQLEHEIVMFTIEMLKSR
jgi:hypothetical protein